MSDATKQKNVMTYDQAMHEINRRLQAVLEEAPSDAAAELEVMRSGRGYKGLLKVYSQQHRFVGGSRASTFQDLIENMFHEVRSQLKAWKKTRFTEAETY